MAIEAIVETLDSVPEALHEHYQQGTGAMEGKFVLSVNPVDGYGLENAGPLKNALQTERQTLKDLQKKYQGISDDDIANLPGLRDAASRLKEIEEAPENSKILEKFKTGLEDKFGRDKQALEDKFGGDLRAKDEEIASLTSQLEKTLLNDKALAAIPQGANSTLLLPHILEQLQIVTNNGTKQVRVRDPNNPDVGRLSPSSGSTEPMSVTELVEEMSKDERFAPCFPGSDASGGGTTANLNDGGSTGDIVLTAAQAKDVATYKAAREKAAKEGRQIRIA